MSQALTTWDTGAAAVFSDMATTRASASGSTSTRSLLSEPSRHSAALTLREGRLEVAYIGDEPNWLWETLRGIQALSRLPENWDTYGSATLSDRAAFEALRLLARILPNDGGSPTLVPMSDGGVQIEWHQGGVDIELGVSPTGSASAFIVDRKQERVFEFETLTTLEFPVLQDFARKLSIE